MAKLPPIRAGLHKVCIICEGYEDYAYIQRLLELNVWNSAYDFQLINAKSESNIFARYQDAYNNDRYEIILVFCDTDKAPYAQYMQLKKKLNDFHGGKRTAADKVIIFANPCTMQIVLLHFGDVSLKNQGKKTNAPVIEKLTGIPDYDAHADQVKALCSKIFKRSYPDMRRRVSEINHPDTVSGSTNFIVHLERFEQDDVKWIREINSALEKQEVRR